MKKNPINVFWFRRDLRLVDNHGLYRALTGDLPVLPLFIFDKNILENLEDQEDARVTFIHRTLSHINDELLKNDSELMVKYGRPTEVWKELLTQYNIQSVFSNRDYEPYARERDHSVVEILKESGVEFKSFKDHVITEAGEVLKQDGKPYTVFTPFKKTWYGVVSGGLEEGDEFKDSIFFKNYPSEKHLNNFVKVVKPSVIIPLEEMGFTVSKLEIPPQSVQVGIIKRYAENRDYPAIEGTSRLGIHFRFGTISIRQKAAFAHSLSKTYLSELIWRDFYSQILAHFPYVAEGPFRKEYAAIKWRNKEAEFESWCTGKTGYPLVDAGMRELSQTGYMHNRVRMVVASFLSKHLLIDWRWGEAWFARKLLDFDLASNNGGWQWAAGCGTDAAPYFRIFNPELQLKKFDKNLEYVKKFVPEYGTSTYPAPIVDHKEARQRCLEVYKKALS